MHRIFSGNGWPVVLGICNRESNHLGGQHPVQQHFILLILCIDVKKIVNIGATANKGLATSAWRPLRNQAEPC